MKNTPKKPVVAIFAGSSTPQDAKITAAAKDLGTKLGLAGYDITYGGGLQGVMGEVAKAAAAAGAKVTAVVLARYAHEEQLPGATMIPVETEQERFKTMTTLNAPLGFFALPGGPGTMREVMQGLELAVYDGGPPVILVKVGAYLDGLKATFDTAVAGGLIKPAQAGKLQLWSLEDALPALQAPAAAPAPAIAAPKP